ncbi:MAG: glycoside hydrolase family 15 protein [Bdellovibrionales bacterium]|nr:glycoside hydrolase family 15 protein [Bdellovibrionales bacterium]
MYPYGLIGNCQVSALISNLGSISWFCVPRPDSPPVFGEILDPSGGAFSILLQGQIDPAQCTQYYLENTNILVTEIQNTDQARIRITDFCPRFEQFGRMYRPASIFRWVEPLKGTPAIQVLVQPVNGWDREPAQATRGNSHVRYDLAGDQFRVTTDMPLTHLTEGLVYRLNSKHTFALTYGAGIEDDLIQVSERFFNQTVQYWRTWVKHCTIPTLFQKETIRSALALKLHCYEDTGAILAALSTSLPEEIGKNRNWDYRYCWLRDAHFVLSALHNLGHFEEMEGFLRFLLEVAAQLGESGENRLAPVYSLGGELPLPETVQTKWRGYRSSAPVRTRNQAAEHIQNDVYGEMVLTLVPIYFDHRFFHLRTPEHEKLLSTLAVRCAAAIGTEDAGLWEIRNGWRNHSFTNLMSWAGLERIHRIQNSLGKDCLSVDAAFVKTQMDRAAEAVMLSESEGSIRNGPKDSTLDASLALASILRFPNQKAATHTLTEIRKNLALGTQRPFSSFFYRYRRQDDFGQPGSAFLICSFWMAQALARSGRINEAQEILADAAQAASPLGLFSEHFDPAEKLQLGNFPQTYSHVGMINAAFDVSPGWNQVL